MRWPDAASSMLSAFDVTSSADQQLLAFQCWTSSKGASLSAFRARVLAKLLAPLLVFCLAAAWWTVNYHTHVGVHVQSIAARTRSRARLRMLGAVAQPLRAQTAEQPRLRRPSAVMRGYAREKWGAHSINGMWNTMLVFMFLVHTSVTKTVMQLFTCVVLGSTGQRFLAASMDENCDSTENAVWQVAVGLPAVVVYVLGVPLASIIWLVMNQAQLATWWMRERAGFLHNGYKENRYYWENVNMLRKAGLAVGTVMSAPMGITLQVSAVLVLTLLAYVAHVNSMPYKIRVLNQAEQVGLVVVMLTMAGGTLLASQQLSGPARSSLTVAVVGTKNAFMAAIVGLAVKFWSVARSGDAGTAARRTGQVREFGQGRPLAGKPADVTVTSCHCSGRRIEPFRHAGQAAQVAARSQGWADEAVSGGATQHLHQHTHRIDHDCWGSQAAGALDTCS